MRCLCNDAISGHQQRCVQSLCSFEGDQYHQRLTCPMRVTIIILVTRCDCRTAGWVRKACVCGSVDQRRLCRCKFLYAERWICAVIDISAPIHCCDCCHRSQGACRSDYHRRLAYHSRRLVLPLDANVTSRDPVCDNVLGCCLIFLTFSYKGHKCWLNFSQHCSNLL